MKFRLDSQDLTQQLDTKKAYQEEMAVLQLDLLHWQRILKTSQRSVILVFEGPDAAGKGGVIKRIVEKLDPRALRVYSTIKPTTEELAHHYLWRFWTKFPARGEFTVFDRSWYGRVLVERVEGFAKEAEWRRAYEEINNLEKTLCDNGAILLKFYLHIDKDEQLRRFRVREADPYKHWKISEEDWRNRDKWSQHNAAAEEMFERTHSKYAPWHLIASNHKWWSRVEVARILVRRMKKDLRDEISDPHV
jgi:polyphosphate kinase 2 (PPK2 family)